MLLCISVTFTTLTGITLNLLTDSQHQKFREKD